MSRTSSLLRLCTASLSSQTIAHRSTSAIRNAGKSVRSRHYSDDKGQDQQAEGSTSKAEGSEAKPASANSESEVQTKLKAKEQEVVDLTGRLRYLQADFLNLQRNAAREKEQTRDFAITRFAGDLLETVDVLSLALKSVPESALASQAAPSPQSTASNSNSSLSASPSDAATPTSSTKSALEYLTELHTGVEMTHRLLLQTLFKYNVKPFDPTGDKFDPNRHEALYQAPIPGKEPGTIIDCQKSGYTIKDRTLRAAQVGVAAETS